MIDEYIKSRNPAIRRASTPNTTSKRLKHMQLKQEKSPSPLRQETPERAVSMLTYHSSAKSINKLSLNKKLDNNNKSYYQSLFDRMKNTILK